MIIKRKIHVSAEEYYDYLLSVLYKELKKDGSRTIKKTDLKPGFKFKKTYMKGKEKVTTECSIEKMKRPLVYKIVFKTKDGTQFVEHNIRSIKDNLIEDTYEEDYQSDDPKIKMKALLKVSSTRHNMAKTVSLIEKEIKNKRKKEIKLKK